MRKDLSICYRQKPPQTVARLPVTAMGRWPLFGKLEKMGRQALGHVEPAGKAGGDEAEKHAGDGAWPKVNNLNLPLR